MPDCEGRNGHADSGGQIQERRYAITMQNQVKQIELAPALAAYGEQAALIARLARIRPSLMQRFLFAPGPAVHATAAYLHICQPTQTDEELAGTIDRTDPRDLLRQALPDAPPRLYRALGRAGDRAYDRAFYENLGKLASGPLGDRLLRTGALNVRRIDTYMRVMICDPLVIQLFRQRALPETMGVTEEVQALVVFLRAHRVPLLEEKLSIPKKAKLPSVKTALEEAFLSMLAPAPPFDIATPFRLVRSVGELRQVGQMLENCLSQRDESYGIFELIDGSTVFIASEAPRMLAALSRVGPDLWHIEQIRGFKNELVSEHDLQRLLEALGNAGIEVLRQEPQSAFAMLSYWKDKGEPDDIDAQMADALENCED